MARLKSCGCCHGDKELAEFCMLIGAVYCHSIGYSVSVLQTTY
uniref:Uncharacterized protein n=1 Tax=Anguilla anguilla TaxID=7936 RepID=A0A0E9UYU9_ANGAN